MPQGIRPTSPLASRWPDPLGLVLLLLAGCSSSVPAAGGQGPASSITCDDAHTINAPIDLPKTLDEAGTTYCLGAGVAGATGEITIAADNVTLYGGGTGEIKSKITVTCKTWSSACVEGYLGAVIQDVRTSGGIELWLGGNHKVLGVCDALEECTCRVGGIALWGTSDNLVSGCRFETNESSQVHISNEVGGAAKNNTFEKSLFLGDNVPDTHFIWLSRDEGTIFQDNLVRVRGIPGGGGMMPQFGSNGNIIRRNTFSMEWVTPAYAASQSISNMFTLRDGTKNLTFEENRVYGNGCIFIFHAGSEGPTGPPQEGNVFRHNLIYQLPVIQDDGQEITAPAFYIHTDPLPFEVIGNTIITRRTPFWEDHPGSLRASDNLLYQIDNSSSCTVDGNHDYNYSESACPAASKPLFVDPFVDRSANPPLLGNFDQLAGSPALGFGVPNHDDSGSGSTSTSGCATSGGLSTCWLFLGFLAAFRLRRRRSAA